MKLKRFIAKDMRTALYAIKEELGADAVIMSNKRTDDGVEIVAGIDEDLAPASNLTVDIQNPADRSDRFLSEDDVSISQNALEALKGGNSLPNPKAQAANLKPGTPPLPQSQGTFAKSLLELLERQKRLNKAGLNRGMTAAQGEPQGVDPLSALSADPRIARQRMAVQSLAGGSEQASAATKSAAQESIPDLDALLTKDEQRLEELKVSGIDSYRQDLRQSKEDDAPDDDEKLGSELAAIRQLLQYELAGLRHDQKMRQEPVKAMLSELLEDSGFSRMQAQDLVSGINGEESINAALRDLKDIVASRLTLMEDDIVDKGGVVALIGPAGVGKTTTLAKLAARFVMRYGPQRVAIVSADHYRIAAFEQLKTYGRIMGCQAYSLSSLGALPKLLGQLKQKALVLLDTAGVGLKDERFGMQIAQLKLQSALNLKHYLVLPATAQRTVLEQAYKQFSTLPLEGLILTKLDEAMGLGDALSLCLSHQLPLAYLTAGQRVPEDISVPSARLLAQSLVTSLEKNRINQK